ncbi:hypothetical protein ON010_g8407 [Phytophthora cinnamomi]|nr:hypothetical protein ON010_g8407 [Phytophthora cinnamomi]
MDPAGQVAAQAPAATAGVLPGREQPPPGQVPAAGHGRAGLRARAGVPVLQQVHRAALNGQAEDAQGDGADDPGRGREIVADPGRPLALVHCAEGPASDRRGQRSSFGTADEHDSLRRTFAKFGKVNLVSLPRFPQSKKFKGFGFVEFAEQRAAEEAVAGASDGADLRGIRAMSKRRWLEMKEQLKLRLSCSDTSEGNTCSAKADDANASDDPNKCAHLVSRTATDKKLKKKRQKPASGGHIHFGDGDSDEQPANSDSNDNQEASAKKQKL